MINKVGIDPQTVLPLELFVKIFDFLDLRSLCLCRVNCLWREAANDPILWRNLESRFPIKKFSEPVSALEQRIYVCALYRLYLSSEITDKAHVMMVTVPQNLNAKEYKAAFPEPLRRWTWTTYGDYLKTERAEVCVVNSYRFIFVYEPWLEGMSTLSFEKHAAFVEKCGWQLPSGLEIFMFVGLSNGDKPISEQPFPKGCHIPFIDESAPRPLRGCVGFADPADAPLPLSRIAAVFRF